MARAGGQPGPDHGLDWLALNRGKRSITLDLTKASGRALFAMIPHDQERGSANGMRSA